MIMHLPQNSDFTRRFIHHFMITDNNYKHKNPHCLHKFTLHAILNIQKHLIFLI